MIHYDLKRTVRSPRWPHPFGRSMLSCSICPLLRSIVQLPSDLLSVIEFYPVW